VKAVEHAFEQHHEVRETAVVRGESVEQCIHDGLPVVALGAAGRNLRAGPLRAFSPLLTI
jgi:hypothetical protein